MATCENLKHARCDIIMGAFVVMRRADRCEVLRDFCHTYGDMAYDQGWPIPDTDFGTCESEPGYCHADSFFNDPATTEIYTRNCGVHHPSWRIARKAEKRL